jgi:hypothetical protein
MPPWCGEWDGKAVAEDRERELTRPLQEIIATQARTLDTLRERVKRWRGEMADRRPDRMVTFSMILDDLDPDKVT